MVSQDHVTLELVSLKILTYMMNHTRRGWPELTICLIRVLDPILSGLPVIN